MIKLAFYSLFRRPLRQFLLFLLIALSAAVPVFLLQVTDGLYEGINHSVSGRFPSSSGPRDPRTSLC